MLHTAEYAVGGRGVRVAFSEVDLDLREFIVLRSSMFLWFVLVGVLTASTHQIPIAPGKYSQQGILDCFHISVSEDALLQITYHGHSLKPVGLSFLPNGEQLQFELKRDDQGQLRGGHHEGTPSIFKAINNTHLLEVQGDKELLWERESDDEVKNQLVEVAMIGRNEDFIREAFSPSSTPPVYYWDGVYGLNECPTVEMSHLDQDHTASKIIGITIAHFRIWQEFYRRHRFGDEEQRILILESDIHCSREFCGDIAIEHINRTDKDLLFIGWCNIVDSSKPPKCTHAYSISVRAAKILINNVFPCVRPIDDQLSELGDSGDLTWATANIGKDYVVVWKTEGLILQNDW